MPNIEKLPAPLLRFAGALASLVPKQIIALRQYRWNHRFINWSAPADLQEYVFATLMNARHDRARLDFLGMLADKVAVRDYVARHAPGLKIPELYGTWESGAQVEWEKLPNKFAIKTNNSCGTNIIVKDKTTLDTAAAARQLDRWLAFPYGALSGQAHYSHIRPLILAEEFLDQHDPAQPLPVDYKFLCFHGEPRIILYYENRKVNDHHVSEQSFDIDWKPLDGLLKQRITHPVPPPASLATMIESARALSKGIDFARVDFYEINGESVFGEITLTPDVSDNVTPEFHRITMAYTRGEQPALSASC